MKISKKLIGQVFLLVIVAGLQYCEIYSSSERDAPPMMRNDDWKDIRLWFTFFFGLASYSFFKLKLYRKVARYLKAKFQPNAFVKLMIISLMILTVFSSFLFLWSLQRRTVVVQPSSVLSKTSDLPEDDLYITQDMFEEIGNEKDNIELPVEIDISQPGNPDNLNRKATQSHYDEYAKIKITLRQDVSPTLSSSKGETDRQKVCKEIKKILIEEIWNSVCTRAVVPTQF
uniref:Uncharacterized protein n=1 Tax=Glossina pallidipes TaxID=7398 RepID=A0A1A9Z7D5_GLOPL